MARYFFATLLAAASVLATAQTTLAQCPTVVTISAGWDPLELRAVEVAPDCYQLQLLNNSLSDIDMTGLEIQDASSSLVAESAAPFEFILSGGPANVTVANLATLTTIPAGACWDLDIFIVGCPDPMDYQTRYGDHNFMPVSF